MVIEFLASIVFGLIAFFIGLFPALPSFSSLNVSISPLLYCFSFLNAFVNLRFVGNCMFIVLLVYNARFIWTIFMWLVRKLPLGVS